MRNKWDDYFKIYYKGLGKTWGKNDLIYQKRWYKPWIEFIDRKIKLQRIVGSKGKAFEVGSSIGAIPSLLQDRAIETIGSDISREIVKKASLVNKGIKFIYCDIQKGIPTKEKYSVIFAFEVLEHLKNPSLGISHIYTSLKKGSYFVGSSPFPFKKNFADPTHCSVKYPSEWKKIFRDVGFTKVRTYPLSFLPRLWKIHPSLHKIIPFYISLPGVVSTTLVIAKK